VILFHDHRLRSRFLDHHCFPLRRPWRFLHGPDHGSAYPLLLQRNQFVRPRHAGHAIGADVVDDKIVVHAGLRHHHHVLDGAGPGPDLVPELGGDHRPVFGFDLVQALPDCRSGQCARTGPDGGARPGVSECVADDCPGPRAQKSSKTSSEQSLYPYRRKGDPR